MLKRVDILEIVAEEITLKKIREMKAEVDRSGDRCEKWTKGSRKSVRAKGEEKGENWK